MMSNEIFPVKLHEILAELEADGRSHIASWAPHGRCFQVHNAALFTETVLGRWFKQSQMTSFQRQLNMYCFIRITSGPDKHSYYHKHFLRGSPCLALGIRRTAVKGKGPRQALGPDTVPDFYAMPFLPTGTLSPPLARVGGTSTLVAAAAAAPMVPLGSLAGLPEATTPTLSTDAQSRETVSSTQNITLIEYHLARQTSAVPVVPEPDPNVPPFVALTASSLSRTIDPDSFTTRTVLESRALETPPHTTSWHVARLLEDHRFYLLESLQAIEHARRQEERRRVLVALAFLNGL